MATGKKKYYRYVFTLECEGKQFAVTIWRSDRGVYKAEQAVKEQYPGHKIIMIEIPQ